MVDRILQLKLIADVSDINRKVGSVEKDVGRMRKAFRGLRGFAGPALVGIGLKAGSAIVDGITKGFADAESYDRAFSELERGLKRVGRRVDASRIATKLDSISFDLGFDDAETLAAFNVLLARTGSVDKALRSLKAAFNLATVRDIPIGAAAREVGNIFKGESEKLEEYGVVRDKTVRNSMRNVRAALGHLRGAAREHAVTVEGVFDRAGVAVDRGFASVAGSATDITEDVLPKLSIIDHALQETFKAFDPPPAPETSTVAQEYEDLFSGDVLSTRAINRWGDDLTGIFGALGDTIDGPLTDSFDELGDTIDVTILPPEGSVEAFFGTLGDTIDGPLTDSFDELGDTADDTFAGGAASAEALTGIFGTLGDTVDGPLTDSFDELGDTADDTFAGAPGAARGPLNTLLGDVEKVLNRMGTALAGSLIGLGTGAPSLTWAGVTIPRLAHGGIVSSPTLALIGERGPEAVVPLDRGLGGVTVNVYASAVSPADVGRSVVEAIEAYERRSSAAWRGAA